MATGGWWIVYDGLEITGTRTSSAVLCILADLLETGIYRNRNSDRERERERNRDRGREIETKTEGEKDKTERQRERKTDREIVSSMHDNATTSHVVYILGMSRLSIRYSVSAEYMYLTTRFYSDSVKNYFSK